MDSSVLTRQASALFVNLCNVSVRYQSHAVHVPLDENLVDGIALTRNSVEASSMLVWGEHCTECVMPSYYALRS